MILTANSRQLSEGPVPGAHSLTHYSVTTKTRQRSACHLLPQTVSGHKFQVYNNIKQSTERRNKLHIFRVFHKYGNYDEPMVSLILKSKSEENEKFPHCTITFELLNYN